jgi:hypothetical protein
LQQWGLISCSDSPGAVFAVFAAAAAAAGAIEALKQQLPAGCH